MSVELEVRLLQPFKVDGLIASLGQVFDEVGIQPQPTVE